MTDSRNFFVPSRLSPPGRAATPDAFGPISTLEEALGGSKAEALDAVNAARERIRSLAERAELALKRGASANEYAALNSLAKACATAQEILNKELSLNQQSARM
jgi:hypothetical protein